MEELNHILNDHTDLVFYAILTILFCLVSLRLFMRRLQRKNRQRRFDDRR